MIDPIESIANERFTYQQNPKWNTAAISIDSTDETSCDAATMSALSDGYERNVLIGEVDEEEEATGAVCRVALNEMNTLAATRKRPATADERSNVDKRSKCSSSSSGDDEEDDAASLGSQDDDESSTVDERADTTPNIPLEGFSIPCSGPNLATMFRNHSINSHMTGTMMGYSVQPYFTNMTNSSMGREFADCNNINMSFLPAHQMAYGVPFPSTSHYAFEYGSSADSFVRGQMGPMEVTNANQLHQRGELCGALSEPSPDSSPGSSELSAAVPKSSEFGELRPLSSITVYGMPSSGTLYSTPLAAQSDTFCTVPGRTSLLSSTTKYHVTIGEIQRRISPPECLNASLLGGILRKAKSKDGGKTLRDSLKQVGLTLPAGRRKAATVTAWTALVEEEALHMARDFATLCEKDFPVRHMAEYACKKSIWQEDIERRRIMIEHTKIVLKELVDIVNADRSPICGSQPPVILASSMQQRLTHFSMLTHGFGNLAFIAVFDTLTSILDEMLRSCERTQSMGIHHSLVTTSHVPHARVLTNQVTVDVSSVPHQQHTIPTQVYGIIRK
uniref:Transcription factor AP-2-epsilon n=1 Tax=Ascaris suum TaxID=6253 RepID=F1KZH3_ASCSU